MTFRLINADVIDGLRQLPDESVQCVVTMARDRITNDAPLFNEEATP